MTRHAYTVTVTWTGNRGSGTSRYTGYDRSHEIAAHGKPSIVGSSDPHFRGDATRWNPEELLVASVSACHQLWYLHLACEAGISVVDYADAAEGSMIEDASGGGSFSEIVLHPKVTIAGGGDAAVAMALHARAHALCFIANSVNFPIRCAPEIVVSA